MTPVVLVCSPLIVATANGSGKPTKTHQLTSTAHPSIHWNSRKTSLLYSPSAAMTTPYISLCSSNSVPYPLHLLCTRKLGCAGSSILAYLICLLLLSVHYTAARANIRLSHSEQVFFSQRMRRSPVRWS